MALSDIITMLFQNQLEVSDVMSVIFVKKMTKM